MVRGPFWKQRFGRQGNRKGGASEPRLSCSGTCFLFALVLDELNRERGFARQAYSGSSTFDHRVAFEIEDSEKRFK